MATTLSNLIDQQLDIAGSVNPLNTRTLADEAAALGLAQTGQTGAVASMAAAGGGVITVTGLTGMTTESRGRFMTISGAASGVNNDTFLIESFISATSVVIVDNGTATGADANNGALNWTERQPYALEDDINFARTDRKLIKGTASHTSALPTYQRPTAVGTAIDANLTNIAAKTTDAQAHTLNRKFENATVAATNTRVTITSAGNLPHAAAIDRTGVPVRDGADAANLDSCYVEIIDPATEAGLLVDGKATGQINTDAVGTAVTPADAETFVLNDGVNAAVTFEFDTNASVVETATLRQVDISAAATDDDVKTAIVIAVNNAPTLTISAVSGGAGLVDLTNSTPGVAGNIAITETVTSANFTVTGMAGGLATAGNRIFGFTEAGAATAPNSVEVAFYSIPLGSPISTANVYTWEAGKPTTVDMLYGFRDRLDNVADAAFRTTLVNGVVGDAGLTTRVDNLRKVISQNLANTDTDLGGLLTNTANFFSFGNLPDGTPSVVEALNTLNSQIGDRNYTGAVLTSGETVVASLQALSTAIGSSNFVRTIERIVTQINAGTPHVIPGGQTYTVDGTNNGQNMTLFTRGKLRDPGPIVDDNDYEETSTTSVTFYKRVKKESHINYYIYQ